MGRERDGHDSDDGVGSRGLHTVVIPGIGGRSHDPITIRLADCMGQRHSAIRLINRMYARRGYGIGFSLPAAGRCVTFTATAQDDVIGTLTLTVDSEAGLAVDRTFKDEINSFRSDPGSSLCELTKFAFDASSPAQPRLAALFHTIFIYGRMHYDCTHLFIEVNPRHCRFYEAMLSFTRVGEPRTNKSVGAPSQLMWLSVANIRWLIDTYAGEMGRTGRSLYAHFLSAEEERQIHQCLVAMSGIRNGPAPVPRHRLRTSNSNEALLAKNSEQLAKRGAAVSAG